MIDLKQEKLKEVFLFGLKLSIFSILLYVISSEVNIYPLQEFTAQRIHELMTLFDFQLEINGVRLISNNFDFIVTGDCTAWKGMFFFFALLASTGKEAKELGKGLLVGLPVIYSINLLRITLLITSALRFSPILYEFLHDTLWHLTMILTVLILWAMWTRRTNFLTNQTN